MSGRPRIFLKIGDWAKFGDCLRLKIWRPSSKIWRHHYFVIFCPRYLMLKTEDLKTAYPKSEDPKYSFMLWEPELMSVTGIQPNLLTHNHLEPYSLINERSENLVRDSLSPCMNCGVLNQSLIQAIVVLGVQQQCRYKDGLALILQSNIAWSMDFQVNTRIYAP